MMQMTDKLRESGLAEPQARAIAEVYASAVQEGGLATKEDVARLEGRIQVLETRVNLMFGFVAAMLLPIFAKIFFGE